jgi:hypothetical protein
VPLPRGLFEQSQQLRLECGGKCSVDAVVSAALERSVSTLPGKNYVRICLEASILIRVDGFSQPFQVLLGDGDGYLTIDLSANGKAADRLAASPKVAGQIRGGPVSGEILSGDDRIGGKDVVCHVLDVETPTEEHTHVGTNVHQVVKDKPTDRIREKASRVKLTVGGSLGLVVVRDVRH